MLAATLTRCVALGLSVRQLEVLPDIDTLEDVRSAWGRLEPLLGARAPELVKRLGSGGPGP